LFLSAIVHHHSANSRTFCPFSVKAKRTGVPLLSLEHYNDETKVATKAAIFRERTIQHRQLVAAASNAKEALLVSLNERGQVDLDHILENHGPSCALYNRQVWLVEPL
jgi:hypothetical protein